MSGFLPNPDFPQEESLICEALVREIIKSRRWSGVVDAWNALLHVRHMAKSLHDEGMRSQAKAKDCAEPESQGK